MKISPEPTWVGGKQKKYPKAGGNTVVDVAVIGGGLTGILSAYWLAKAGKSVAVLEGKMLGSGATSYTTAFITQVVDTDLGDLIKMFGPKHASLIWQSGREAIDTIEAVIKKEKIDCEFERCPAYIYAANEKEYKILDKKQEAASRLGFRTTLSKHKKFPFEPYGVFEIKDQAKFHPMKFLRGVAAAVERAGGKIFEHTKAIGLGENRITVAGGNILAKDIIVATYAPFNNPKDTHYKKGMYGSYVFEVQFAHGIFEEGIYWNLDNPYHYFRIDRQGKSDRMVVGGEDHREELPVNKKKAFAALKDYVDGLMGGRPYQIARKWTGPVLEPSDGIPLIGAYQPHQFVAAAFSGNGMTYAMISALIFRDLIMKKKNPWIAVYDPKRKLTAYRLAKKGIDYTEEFFGGAVKNTLRRKR